MSNSPLRTRRTQSGLIAACLACILAACAASDRIPQQSAAFIVPATTTQAALVRTQPCEGRFVRHALDFVNGARMREIRTYASNGSGLASGDLDGDGDLDLLFASIDGQSTILWNNGDLDFRAEPIEDRFTRAAGIVDVDGDSALDLVFTHRGVEGVSFWRNQGKQAAGTRFVRAELPGVDHYAYSMAWGDLNGDGALDLVTGAYDAELKNHGVADEEIRRLGGVVVYEQHAGRFNAVQLTQRAEALAIGLVDLNGDARLDILIANDFAVPDGHWLNYADRWELTAPFRETSHSTMSMTWGDLQNNGRTTIFSTDMNPGSISTTLLADWLPVISKLEEKHGPFDPQIMANTLQVPDGPGGWRNEAAQRGIDATGWSWSAKFGDLDNDGFLDLYVVNGMIAENLFEHLPGGELIEENHAFRNLGDGSFVAQPEWDLGSTASGRGMLMADLDNDGDLDIAVNNLRSRALLFENRLCNGNGLAIDLAWPSSNNPYVLGAVLELHTDIGVLRRDVHAMSGYLSGDPPRIHFGFPSGARLDRLVVRYPDGATATIADLQPQTRILVTR